jgi:hypothetical protein
MLCSPPPSPLLQVAALQQHLPLLGRQHTAQQAQQSRFARAIRTQQADHFAGSHL